MLSDRPLRLLPWSTPGGDPCYLLAGPRGNGRVSRIADRVEAEQLTDAGVLVEWAVSLLDDRETAQAELLDLGWELVISLREVLRVVESRGERLSVAGDDEIGDDQDGDDGREGAGEDGPRD